MNAFQSCPGVPARHDRVERPPADCRGMWTRRPRDELCRAVSGRPSCVGRLRRRIDGDGDARAAFAEAFEKLAICDAAHAIPAGVYLEE